MRHSLASLAEKYCCDKFFRHNYIPHYELLFENRDVKRLLEIGIGYEHLMKPFVPKYIHGASLWMWRDYFPEAEIFACDIHGDTLINEGPISSFLCDQSKQEDLEQLIEDTGGNFDVIIDDGSHEPLHQILSAQVLLPYVNPGGVYVIEDALHQKQVVEALGYGEVVILGPQDDILIVIEK